MNSSAKSDLRTAPPIVVQVADPCSAAATKLLQELTAELSRRYNDLGDDGTGAFSLEDARMPRSAFVVAWLNGQPIGCGALRPVDLETAEIKRMYVSASARRLGIGGRILAELERLAGEFGYRTMRLETGNRQPEAIALYERYGFRHIPPFGRYVDNPVSICFEKNVTPYEDGTS